jgi:BlaI family transcriptional regulator, penicillinase repressor
MAKKTRVLTPLERRIMRVLWEGGAGNVQKVLQGLTGEPQLAYTTVQTTLNVDDLLLSLVRSSQLDAKKLAELQVKLQASESVEEGPE